MLGHNVFGAPMMDDYHTSLTSEDNPTPMGLLFSKRVKISEAMGRITDSTRHLHPEEKACIQKSVKKRRNEFATGRMCARSALKKLGLACQVIPMGEQGEPAWPAGIVGSITHTQGYCAVVVAKRKQIRGLGCDVEIVRAVSEKLWHHIVSQVEMDTFKKYGKPRLQHLVAISFCAKECFYKYQFPLSGQWLDFLDVDIAIDQERNVFSIKPQKDIPNVCQTGEFISGTYRFWDKYVMTGIEASAV
jgi:4'-phosphopantetheinyl transferase EntD